VTSTSSIAASPAAMAVDRYSRFVYVTGATAAIHGVSPDYLTIAYNAATGAQQWISRYDGTAHGTDRAAGVAVTPNDFATIAHVARPHTFVR